MPHSWRHHCHLGLHQVSGVTQCSEIPYGLYFVRFMKEELLKELDEAHSQKELSIMEMHRGVEKAAEKIETASKFTERVLAHGNGVEVLSMKKAIMTQLLMLRDSMPRVVTDVSIEFRVDPKAFAVALLAACGQLKKNLDDKVICTLRRHSQLVVTLLFDI